MIQFKNITKYKGLFEKCHMEPIPNGFSVFDANQTFIGTVLDEGFAIDKDYKYKTDIIRELTKKGIAVFDFDTFNEVTFEEDIAEILYGNVS